MTHDGLQQHSALRRRDPLAHLEERLVALLRERLERLDGRIRSTGSSNSSQPRNWISRERSVSISSSSSWPSAHWLRLSVRPMTLTSYCSTARRIAEPQPQPMSEQRHPRPQIELGQRQVDLGELRLLQSSCPRARSTRSCRSGSGPGTARRTRWKCRSALGRPRTPAASSPPCASRF